MQKYFISNDEFINNKITSDDVFHIRNVMRAKIGTNIIVSNEVQEFICEITEIEKNHISFNKITAINNKNELPFLIDIYQGYPKGDKLDDIIKHSVELGVNNLYGVITKRSLFKLDEQRKDSKIARYNKIAKEAAEQSNRKILPKFMGINKLEKIDFLKYDIKIVCYEESAKDGESSNFKNAINRLKPGMNLCVLIGPEGGFDTSEIDYLVSNDFIICGLGPRILRTETASMYVLSSISYEWELK